MKKDHLNTTDFNLWHTIREETAAAAAAEPMLASFLHQTVLRHDSLDSVLAYHLSSKLGSPIMDVRALFEIYQQALGSDARISNCVEADLKAIYERDPACDEYSLPLLYFRAFGGQLPQGKGYQLLCRGLSPFNQCFLQAYQAVLWKDPIGTAKGALGFGGQKTATPHP